MGAQEFGLLPAKTGDGHPEITHMNRPITPLIELVDAANPSRSECHYSQEMPACARRSERIKRPLVMSEPKIRFYAGATLTTNGQALGTLCVLDRVPRELSPEQLEALRALSRRSWRTLSFGVTSQGWKNPWQRVIVLRPKESARFENSKQLSQTSIR